MCRRILLPSATLKSRNAELEVYHHGDIGGGSVELVYLLLRVAMIIHNHSARLPVDSNMPVCTFLDMVKEKVQKVAFMFC